MVLPLGLTLGILFYQLVGIIKKKVFIAILYVIANVKNSSYAQ